MSDQQLIHDAQAAAEFLMDSAPPPKNMSQHDVFVADLLKRLSNRLTNPPILEPYRLPVRPYPHLLRWPLRWLQRRCRHHALKADVMQGCCGNFALRWCETCGAIWMTIEGTPCGSPRMCEPTWEDKT